MSSATPQQDLVLTGCAPEPLMGYLKSLGIFRLVAEQKEPDVLACWRNDTLVLLTALSRDELARFFLTEYRPTPITAPWNGGSGFHTKDNRQALEAIQACGDTRLDKYQKIIQQIQEIISALGDSRSKDSKQSILAECRNRLPDDVLPWLDAAYVLSSDGPRYPPLLGTGGNDGRLEFSNNFMQNLVFALDIQAGESTRRPRISTGPKPEALLDATLFGESAAHLMKDRTAGQFAPGSVGGPNATAGFNAESLTNPWDYVLMLEGALFFAGAVARRLSSESRSKAIFPFTVDMSAAGYGTAVGTEYSQASRAEVWMPLWNRPATYREIAHVFAEGRAQLGPRQAASGADFARAVASLGVERGIAEFARYGFLMRSGRSYLATYLGRFRVTSNPRVDVLFEVDGWLRALRNLASGQDAPEGLRRALRQIDEAIMDLCQVRQAQAGPDAARKLQSVLTALGRAETWLSRSQLKERVPPLPGLGPHWLQYADDGSREFRIAAAIASIQGVAGSNTAPIRVNLEPVKLERRRWIWTKDSPSVVWQGVDLIRDMATTLQRRCLETGMQGSDHDGTLPLHGKANASPGDILALLDGQVDERRIAQLVPPLAAVRWDEVADTTWAAPAHQGDQPLLPLAYATLKLLFLPWKFRPAPGHTDVQLKPEPAVIALLSAGRAEEAYAVAWRRLYVSGFTPLSREGLTPPHLARRLEAVLLIPIRYSDMYMLADMALVPAADSA